MIAAHLPILPRARAMNLIGLGGSCSRTEGDRRAIDGLKAEQGGELKVHGSGKLVRWLFKNDLVDEINLLIVPVVVGQGARPHYAT